MTSIQKHLILESLKTMDQAQTERVLQYVKSIAEKPAAETAYEQFKRNAMKEIRHALGEK
jgi:hypothetical protein